MNKVVVMVMAVSLIAASAQAKNYVYGDSAMMPESEGYKLFASDRIVDTVAKVEADKAAGFCSGVEENTAKSLGEANTLRSDKRLAIGDSAKVSYATSCSTFNSVVERLKSPDDVRRLWLLFADSATDDYAAETLQKKGPGEDASVLIEMRRMAVVAKYIEFFTKNTDWKLTDYTFLSQAFKARKDRPLSPAYSQFVAALLTGDTEKASQVVKAVDLDNLGARFMVPGASDGKKEKGAGTHGP